ncbi:MAG: SAM-dependent chlorinase/fluorinase [Bacteroidota bacterium]|nr:SAM-dependent chlorinase/fluorinase [Bacteroidota bacterium]MDX5430868.1 SAM-dependent chlorinase/fluorinase [Bacteroidota bacterium]MDX5469612.1 SAM-dependent chlorinase/fluorinase [Bacteroidota bacterium]
MKKELSGVDFEMITGSITRHDLNEAAYVLDAILTDFEEDSIHIVDVESDMKKFGPALVARVQNQWVISANNGLLSLLRHGLDAVFEENEGWSEKGGTFSLLNTFLPLAQRLVMKGSAGMKKASEIEEKAGLAPTITENAIRGAVIFVDNFGNAVTNITREDLDRAAKGRKLQIHLNRFTRMTQISDHYANVPVGEATCVWTNHDYLQVSIYHGEADRLLGLEKGKMITIEFE